MKAYICDCCGTLTTKAVRVQATVVHFGQDFGTWSAGAIPGEYCQNCADEISAYVRYMKERSENPDIPGPFEGGGVHSENENK